MYRSNTYNIFTTHREPLTVPPATIKPRLKSLQKIKINHKGLPNDFFKLKTADQTIHSQQRNQRVNTLPNDLDDVRVTPKFLQPETYLLFQRRQSKSQSRTSKPTLQINTSASPFVQNNNQVTFSNHFFTSKPKKRPKTITIKSQRDRQPQQSKPIQCIPLSCSVHKSQLAEIMKRKHLDKQKYPLLLCPRAQPRPNYKFPNLKARYPSAFGV